MQTCLFKYDVGHPHVPRQYAHPVTRIQVTIRLSLLEKIVAQAYCVFVMHSDYFSVRLNHMKMSSNCLNNFLQPRPSMISACGQVGQLGTLVMVYTSGHNNDILQCLSFLTMLCIQVDDVRQ